MGSISAMNMNYVKEDTIMINKNEDSSMKVSLYRSYIDFGSELFAMIDDDLVRESSPPKGNVLNSFY